MDRDEYDFLFKIIFVGDSGVGKSSLLSVYVNKIFDINIKSTIGVEFATKTINMDNYNIKLQIWDTAGQERYRAITSAYYRGALGVFLVFDVTNEISFYNLDRWIEEITNNSSVDIKIVIIGNKSDKTENRKIPTQMAMNYCEKKGYNYFETSALRNSQIEEVFYDISKQIYDNKKIELQNYDNHQMYISAATQPIKLENSSKSKKKSCCKN